MKEKKDIIKSNFCVCYNPICRSVNPIIIISEIWNIGDDGPCEIKILMLKPDLIVDIYECTTISLRAKKIKKKTIQLYQCGKCNSPMKKLSKREVQHIQDVTSRKIR